MGSPHTRFATFPMAQGMNPVEFFRHPLEFFRLPMEHFRHPIFYGETLRILRKTPVVSMLVAFFL